MSKEVPDTILDQLQKRKTTQSFRKLQNLDHLFDFSSNDYLGLSRHPVLKKRLKALWSVDGDKIGGTGSRLITGSHVPYQEAEVFLAELFRGPSALLYNSGYAACQGVVSSIPQRGDLILYDQLAHVCLKEGARLSTADAVSFRHNDLNDLELKLKKKIRGNVYVVTETLFSMDGDLAPLEDIIRLCEQYGAWLIVDEAHTTGVYGEGGSGYLRAAGLHDRVLARIYTFGKGMGLHGACVVGSDELIDYLINFSHTFIYTTSLPPHSVRSVLEVFYFLGEHIDLQARLQKKIALFRLLYPQAISHTAIQPVMVAGNQRVMRAAQMLQNFGFDVRAIRSPTVREGTERLRISLHAHNSDEEIKQLVDCLRTIDDDLISSRHE